MQGEQDGTKQPATCGILYMAGSNPYNIHFYSTVMGTRMHSYIREDWSE
jgi:hypothetical protein